MKNFIKLLTYVSIIDFSISAIADRPRGVGPKNAHLYPTNSEFKCIFNPSIILKHSQINDDYCDCPDGSDEPGTAACSSVSSSSLSQLVIPTPHNTTLAIPGFYCNNQGHIPAYLPLMNVNDGVCDYDLCCDGSDEWAGIGGVKCTNQCKEMGREWKLQQEIKYNLFKSALTKRSQLVSKAKTIRAELETKIQNLHQEIADSEGKIISLKKKYEDIQRRERGRMLRSDSVRKEKKINVLANLITMRFDQLRQALSGVVSKSNALQKRVDELEKILSAFKEDYNPNFNDEGVKRAVKAWEDYAATQKAAENEAPEYEEYDIDVILKEDNEGQGINWDEFKSTEDSDALSCLKFEEYLPVSLRNWISEKSVAFRILLMDRGILPPIDADEVESKVVTEAREAFETESSELTKKQISIKENREDLDKDYGKDDVFRALKGRCLEKDSGEYTYELCWLEGTKQKSKKSGSQTIMGTFYAFDKLTIDGDDVRIDDGDHIDLSSGERLTLKYGNGQNCWNGPSRETLVVLGCADEDVIWKISELEKCKYRMDVGTPAACDISKKI
ncbi:Glucosidase 2 subunit beta [Golovinomyces cichoracearum]|uniref:Glucosidase 2 subunit beta n=1 Tax=Golovinomyces cichoracearum TaxID=62708 RepID=A0A420IU08_9PEZI|nr:Glucosidase 2 subunit beta [Golovinomyces cichoracearum]